VGAAVGFLDSGEVGSPRSVGVVGTSVVGVAVGAAVGVGVLFLCQKLHPPIKETESSFEGGIKQDTNSRP
jgi:hypothetical protein